ncbi:unnamed protein product, partial [Laminaria digitata]
DEASFSGGVEPEPPVPTPQPAHRMSSTSRVEKDALSLSKPTEPIAAPGDPVSSARGSDPLAQAAGGVRRVSTANMTDIARQLFVASPAYPSGVGGVITSSRSTGAGAPSPSLPASSSGRETGKQSFKMVFDKTLPVTPGREEATVEMLPVGLEAVCDENGGAISIRELLPSGSGGVGAEGPGGVIARIEALRSVGGAREAVYSVILGEDGGAAEVMAARVSSHPTRLAAPREVRAVLLLPPPHREDSDGRGSKGGKSEISVFDRATGSRGDGLWQAAADGKVSEDAFELHSKAAAWSSTTGAFELDLLEAWRPGQIGTGSSPKSSQPAPETVQMVPAAAASSAKPSTGDGSARSSNSSSSERTGEGRLPSMQLVRVNDVSARPTAGDANGNGHISGTISSGDNSGGGASWKMAVAAPVPVLHGFCLAVIGLTTEIVGENVTLVDRSAVPADEVVAVGFMGFDQVRMSNNSSPPLSPPLERNPGSYRQTREQSKKHRVEQHFPRGEGRDKEVVTPLPLLALGEVAAPAFAREKHADAKQKAEGGSSSRASSRRSIGSGSARAVQTSLTPGAANIEKGVSYDDAGRIGQSGHSGDQLAKLGDGGGGGGSGGGGGTGQGGGGVLEDNALPRTVPIPIKRRMTVTMVASVVVDKVYRNTYLCNLCLLTLTVSFAADLYPGVPSHNVPLSAALLWASCNVDGVRALRRRSFAYVLSALVLISLFIDVDFLASALKPYALIELEQEDDDLQGVIVGSHMHVFGRIVVGTVALLQALSWQGILATSPQGVHALNLFWRRFKLFLPVWGSPRKLTKEV